MTDLVVDERVILELEVADTIHQTHVAQLLSYLAITKLQVGLVFNFKTASLTFQHHANIYRK